MSVLKITLFDQIISLLLIPFFVFVFMLSFIFQPVVAQESSEPNQTESSVSDQANQGNSSTSTPEILSGRPKLAVFSFVNPPEYANSNIGLGLTEMLVTKLAQSGRFDVIQRFEDLELIMGEIGLGSEGIIQQDQETEIGHVEGVDYYMTGMVTYFGYEQRGFLGLSPTMVVRLDFKLFNASTGQVILAETAEGDKAENFITTSDPDWSSPEDVQRGLQSRATIEAIDNLMAKIFPFFTVQACIANVTPDFLIIDLGSAAGIEEGIEFDVFQVSILYGPSGEETWRDESLIGRIRVTEVQLNSSKAVIVSGENLQVGDICKLPEVDESLQSD
ncbi:MAG: hypothetical protein NTY09_13850 [bacterium]|nr:hypothetical protein [bacterium]